MIPTLVEVKTGFMKPLLSRTDRTSGQLNTYVMKRLFIGIPLSSDLKLKIEPLLLELKLPGVSLVARENLHFTLKFLGEVEEEKLPEIEEKLTKLALLTPSFRVELKGIGTFPGVVWMGVESKELVQLMQAIDRELGYIRKNEYRKEVPHLTLARIKGNGFNLGTFMAKHKTFSAGTLRVEKLCLFEAKLTSKELIYIVLAEKGLKTSLFK